MIPDAPGRMGAGVYAILEALKVAGYDMVLEIHCDYSKAIAAF